MTPEEQQFEAQSFLNFYIQGSDAPGAEAQFPDSHEPGMKFRSPALHNIRPEHDDEHQPDAEQTFEPGDGPEPIDERYRFVDRCALQLARVTVLGEALEIRFVFVNRYPPGRFPPDPESELTVMLPFSSGASNSNINECLDRLEEYLGASDEFQPILIPVETLLDLDDFENQIENGDL